MFVCFLVTFFNSLFLFLCGYSARALAAGSFIVVNTFLQRRPLHRSSAPDGKLKIPPAASCSGYNASKRRSPEGLGFDSHESQSDFSALIVSYPGLGMLWTQKGRGEGEGGGEEGRGGGMRWRVTQPRFIDARARP